MDSHLPAVVSLRVGHRSIQIHMKSTSKVETRALPSIGAAGGLSLGLPAGHDALEPARPPRRPRPAALARFCTRNGRRLLDVAQRSRPPRASAFGPGGGVRVALYVIHFLGTNVGSTAVICTHVEILRPVPAASDVLTRLLLRVRPQYVMGLLRHASTRLGGGSEVRRG